MNCTTKPEALSVILWLQKYRTRVLCKCGGNSNKNPIVAALEMYQYFENMQVLRYDPVACLLRNC
jgi:hypothetical protein